MKYRGSVGEFHWYGFVLAFLACFAFALILFTRFQYVKDAGEQGLRIQSDPVERELRQLHGDVQQLNARISADEQRTSNVSVNLQCCPQPHSSARQSPKRASTKPCLEEK